MRPPSEDTSKFKFVILTFPLSLSTAKLFGVVASISFGIIPAPAFKLFWWPSCFNSFAFSTFSSFCYFWVVFFGGDDWDSITSKPFERTCLGISYLLFEWCTISTYSSESFLKKTMAVLPFSYCRLIILNVWFMDGSTGVLPFGDESFLSPDLLVVFWLLRAPPPLLWEDFLGFDFGLREFGPLISAIKSRLDMSYFSCPYALSISIDMRVLLFWSEDEWAKPSNSSFILLSSFFG